MAASPAPNQPPDGAAGESGPRAETPGDVPAAEAGKVARAKPMDDGPAGGEGGSPVLTLAGFSGPLDHLLTLARAQRIDLSAVSLAALVAQLATALRQAPATTPLGEKADWVVMAAWLVQLRSRLLLPTATAAQQEAAAEADQLRARLVVLDHMQALAGWLERRPQLGHDVFARGHPPSRAQAPELFGISVEAGQGGDVVEFLWASLALFDDAPEPETASLYRPRPFALYTIAAARDRIRRRLIEAQGGVPLDRLMPDAPETDDGEKWGKIRRRSAWSSTLIASLELAKMGEVALRQGADFEVIHVVPA